MKKILMLLLMTTVFLCGCHANSEKEDASEYCGELSKAQEIAVLPANTSTATQILAESEEISDFISALDMEHWELKTLPKEAKLVGTFQFSQEETIKFGESATDGELYPVCELLCYEDIPYVTLEVDGMKMTFKVSDTAIEYLADYFQ
ncbi:MAG: hypothetical protein J6K58_08790 [Lachnospiraceae bacterium]|nr:hypothetical protein [Lachnospiraceae bacterium]